MHRSLWGLYLLLFFLGTTPVFSQDFLSMEQKQWLYENQPIQLAVDSFNPPMNYLNQQKEIVGLTIDYMNFIEDQLGIEFEYITGTWAEGLDKAIKHEVDGIVNASIKEERKPYLNFTDPYFNTPDALLTLSDTPLFQSPDSFSGKPVAVIRGSARKEVFLNYSPDSEILEVDTLEEGVVAVLEQTAVGFLDEMAVIENLLDQYFVSNVKLNSVIFFPELGTAHIGVRNDDIQLVTILNLAIDQLTPSDHERIRARYLHQDDNRGILVDPGFTRQEREWLKAHPVIKVGEDDAWAPIQFSDNGTPSGISLEYLNLLEPVMGVEFQIEQNQWQQILNQIQNKKLDILSCARQTPDRDVYLNFTDPYLTLPIVMLGRGDFTLIRPQNFDRYRIGLLQGYAAEELFSIHYPEVPYQGYIDLEQGIKALQNNEVDILIENQLAINHYLLDKRILGLQIIGDLPFSYDLGMGVRKDWPLLVSILNKSLNTLTEEQHLAIYQKWNYIAIKKEVDYKRIFILTLIFSFLLIILSLWTVLVSRRARLRSRQLEDSRRMEAIGKMAGGIVHDFKNLLMGISGYTELLKMGELTDKQEKEFLDQILEAVDSGTELTNQILLYTRGNESDFQEINVSLIMNNIKDILSHSSKLILHINSDIDSNCYMYGDAAQIKQLILNLGTNAIQAMEESKRKVLSLTLRELPESNSLLIRIEDSGSGIPNKIKNKIFDPYFSTRKRDKGTGLGLATVDRIIKNHKGRLILHTEENLGTVFSVYLPRHLNEEKS